MQADFIRDLKTAVNSGGPLKELRIASAYTSLHGIRLLKRLIGASEARHAILGCNALTDWQALDWLCSREVDVRLRPEPPGGIFHPKCLYAERADGHAWVLAGSANLTEGGLERNVEGGIRVAGPRDLPVMKEARRFFDDLTETSLPLTTQLLAQFRAAHGQFRQVAVGVEPGLAAPTLLDPGQALRLTPAGQALTNHLNVHRFFHYIETTRMEASYKMVILPLLLQSAAGRMTMVDLAHGFGRFYALLKTERRVAERKGIGMSGAGPGMPLARVLQILKGAPREALSRSGLVLYRGDMVEMIRPVWDPMTPADREHARVLAISRLRRYYQEALGLDADYDRLLRLAQPP